MRNDDDFDTIDVVIDEGGFLPLHAHDDDAGYDLRSPDMYVIHAHESVVIDTKLRIFIPSGYTGFLKSKSGLNVKHNIVSEGVIDAGYTNTIKVKLYNHGDEDYVVDRGDKITQIVFLPIVTPQLSVVDYLPKTERGERGFGSSGR